jgi:hypothetical protein
MVKKICFMCGEKKNVFRDVIISEDQVNRVFDFCPTCWIIIYKEALNTLFGHDEYKVTQLLKNICDTVIAKTFIRERMGDKVEKLEDLDPDNIREVKEISECDEGCECQSNQPL